MSRSASAIQANFDLAIRPSNNGRHLCSFNAPEEPFFWLADTAWELFHRLDKAEAELFLRNRAAKGFNVVMIVLFAEHGGLDYPNRYGQWPFEGGAPGSLPDLSKPNLGYYEFVDWVVDLAASLGIRIALVPTWGRYINGGYYKEPILFNEENAYSFGRFVGKRYPFLPYIVGGDSNRYWNPAFIEQIGKGIDTSKEPLTDFGPVYEALARGLVEGEATHKIEGSQSGYKTFITYHSAQVWLPHGPVSTGGAQFPDADWLTLDCIQSGHHNEAPDGGAAGSSAQAGGVGSRDPKTAPQLWRAMSSYLPIRQMYNTPRPDGTPRPCVDLEAHYENTHHWFNYDKPLWVADNIRRGAWQGIFSGACGYTYGCNSIWQMHSAESKTHPPIAPPTTAYTNWSLELDLAGAFQSGIAKRIVESLPGYFDRIPDQGIILSDTNEKEGKPADEELICGMRENTGRWAMIQLPFGGSVEVDMKRALAGNRGKWRAWWWDPRIGSREVFASCEEEEKRKFTAPDNQDWLLFIEII